MKAELAVRPGVPHDSLREGDANDDAQCSNLGLWAFISSNDSGEEKRGSAIELDGKAVHDGSHSYQGDECESSSSTPTTCASFSSSLLELGG
ncbi:MAG: hypothetical protein ACFB9N_14815 [Geitlerinemataceae cyanobacterium]